jgi:predicted negative regulator of RcsB-dependent stress response
MDEEIAIIDSNTRTEKIKNFFKKHIKKIIIFFIGLVLILVSFFVFNELKNKTKIKISNLYNSTIISYTQNTKNKTKENLLKVIEEKDPTYSPLSLYFIIDNDLINNRETINNLFDFIIKKISLEKEIKNLIIYKKALYNADFIEENELLSILNPIINSNSIWKSQALYLVAEYFFSKNEKQKSKEFYNKIINLENSNSDIKLEAQKRLNRDLGE